jgi:hypothetical protein
VCAAAIPLGSAWPVANSGPQEQLMVCSRNRLALPSAGIAQAVRDSKRLGLSRSWFNFQLHSTGFPQSIDPFSDRTTDSRAEGACRLEPYFNPKAGENSRYVDVRSCMRPLCRQCVYPY